MTLLTGIEQIDWIPRRAAADIYRALGDARAPLAATLARDEERETIANLAGASDFEDDLYDLYAQVPERNKRQKHSNTCWQDHTPCFAEMIRKLAGWAEE